MAEWPEQLLAIELYEGYVTPCIDTGPRELVEELKHQVYVPNWKLEEVERELGEVESERDGLQTNLARASATLDALVGEVAVEAGRQASRRDYDFEPNRDVALTVIDAALQAAKKQAGGGGE